MGHWNGWDDWNTEATGAEMAHRKECCPEEMVERRDHACPHHRRWDTPVGDVTVDCTPKEFRTPGQAVNIVSCPVSQVLNVPVTRTVKVQVPLGNGCVLCVPLTEQVQVPVVATVNLPPVLTPVPNIVCPPTA